MRIVGSTPWPPASNFYPFPVPLPRCHMGSGLQLGAPPTTQSRCRELPPTPSRRPVPSPGNRLCSCSVSLACGGSGRDLGRQPVVVSVRAPERQPLGGAWARPPLRHPRGGAAIVWAEKCCMCHLKIIQVCAGGGWQVLHSDLGEEEEKHHEPRSRDPEAGWRVWESGHMF